MRTLAFLKKTFLENVREWKILILALTFAPFFVYLMYAYFGASAPAYRLIVINRDAPPPPGAAEAADLASGLIRAWRAARHPNRRAVFTVTEASNLDAAEASLRSRDADLLVVIPAGFSHSLADYRDRKSEKPVRIASPATTRAACVRRWRWRCRLHRFGYVALATNSPRPSSSTSGAWDQAARSQFDLCRAARAGDHHGDVHRRASLIREVDRGR
jgi:hypothetical protein